MGKDISQHLDTIAMMGTLQDEIEGTEGMFHRVAEIAPEGTDRILVIFVFEREGKEPITLHAEIRPGVLEADPAEGWKQMRKKRDDQHEG